MSSPTSRFRSSMWTLWDTKFQKFHNCCPFILWLTVQRKVIWVLNLTITNLSSFQIYYIVSVICKVQRLSGNIIRAVVRVFPYQFLLGSAQKSQALKIHLAFLQKFQFINTWKLSSWYKLFPNLFSLKKNISLFFKWCLKSYK